VKFSQWTVPKKGLSGVSKDYRVRISVGFSEFVNELRHIPARSAVSISRTWDRRSPFGVVPPEAGNASRFRLKLSTMRRIGEIPRANFLERCSGPRSGLERSRPCGGRYACVLPTGLP